MNTWTTTTSETSRAPRPVGLLPEDVGMASYAVRRVAGPRREEVAVLAQVTSDSSPGPIRSVRCAGLVRAWRQAPTLVAEGADVVTVGCFFHHRTVLTQRPQR
jgi:hypothetical protein